MYAATDCPNASLPLPPDSAADTVFCIVPVIAVRVRLLRFGSVDSSIEVLGSSTVVGIKSSTPISSRRLFTDSAVITCAVIALASLSSSISPLTII